MTSGSYELVFDGEILDGFDREHVKAEFARLFNLTAERVEQVFSRSTVVLRKNLDSVQGTQYQSALLRLGLKTVLRPVAGALQRPVVSADPAPEEASVAPPSRTGTAAGTVAAGVPARVADLPEAADVAEAVSERHLRFEFSGDGFEFFKIWIVNILLSIVTLGIYSAWAKVRTLRYFYGNTRLDEASFEYLANPLSILKGRLIAFAFFAAYSSAELVSPLLPLALSAVLMLAMPWIIVRALVFRTRNTAYRNVRFGFDGRVRDAVSAFVLWPLAGMLTLGFMMPYAMHRQAAFVVGNSRYGTAPFAYHARVNAFYKVFFTMIGLFIAGALAAGALGLVLPNALKMLPFVTVYLVVFAYANVARTNLVYGHASLAPHRFASHYELGSYIRLMLGNMLGLALTLGLFYPWAKVRTARYAAEHVTMAASGSLDDFSAGQQREVSALGQEIGEVFDMDLGL